jgi:hypothetical protein
MDSSNAARCVPPTLPFWPALSRIARAADVCSMSSPILCAIGPTYVMPSPIDEIDALDASAAFDRALAARPASFMPIANWLTLATTIAAACSVGMPSAIAADSTGPRAVSP